MFCTGTGPIQYHCITFRLIYSGRMVPLITFTYVPRDIFLTYVYQIYTLLKFLKFGTGFICFRVHKQYCVRTCKRNNRICLFTIHLFMQTLIISPIQETEPMKLPPSPLWSGFQQERKWGGRGGGGTTHTTNQQTVFLNKGQTKS